MCVLYPMHGCIGMSHIFSDYCGPVGFSVFNVMCRFSARPWESLPSSSLSSVWWVFSTWMPLPMVWLPPLRDSGDLRWRRENNNDNYNFLVSCLSGTLFCELKQTAQYSSFSTSATHNFSSGQMPSNIHRVLGWKRYFSQALLKRIKWGVSLCNRIASSL